MDHDERLSVIALHGLALPMLQHLGCAGIRWVFAKAPCRPVTIPGGRPALAWYDVCGHWITRRLLGDASRWLHGHMTDGRAKEGAAPALESVCALAPSAWPSR